MPSASSSEVGAVDDLVDPCVEVAIPPLLPAMVAGPDTVVVARHQDDPSEEAAKAVDRAIESTHARIAEEPDVVVGADRLVPAIDQEGVEAGLGSSSAGPSSGATPAARARSGSYRAMLRCPRWRSAVKKRATTGPSSRPRPGLASAIRPSLSVGHSRDARAPRDEEAARPREGRRSRTDGEASTTALGDWFATALFWRPQVALLVNTQTFVPVFMELAPAAKLLDRAPAAIEAVLRRHGVPEQFLAAERVAMAESRIGPTNERSVLGVMNEMAFYGEQHFRAGLTDLELLSLRVAHMPIGPLRKREGFPDRELEAFVGGFESLAEVIPIRPGLAEPHRRPTELRLRPATSSS